MSEYTPVLHRITGNQTLEDLADLYEVPWKQIAISTFGSDEESYIYDYLSANKGKKQEAYTGHPSGFHWTFSNRMVAIIPEVTVSKSPVIPGDDSIPGGPVVENFVFMKGTAPIGTLNMTGYLVIGGAILGLLYFMKKK